MFRSHILCLCLCFSTTLFAQETTIEVPMDSEGWSFDEGAVEFSEKEGRTVMQVVDPLAYIVVSNLTFENGTIEYDVILPEDVPFTSLYFRYEDENEGEWFYTRNYRMGDPGGYDAIQYAAQVKGVTLWDLKPDYQGPANLKADTWNKVKLVISGKRMRAYINNMKVPALDIARLEGNVTEGKVALQGFGQYSNFVIKPDAVEDLPPGPGIDPTFSDPRYIRTWQVSEPLELLPGRELISVSDRISSNDSLSGSRGLLHSDNWPDQVTAWTRVDAERLGLINLTREYGESERRRAVWLKSTLIAEKDQVRELRFGFSDEVWIMLNGQLLYVDKNIYANPIQKAPNGRISIENATVSLPLMAGENELVVGVANSFFGWGLMARLDSREGIQFK